ncbi:MFS transporter [Catenovulum sp. 2E275]|uniref:MFS transporter n=1 Tax=Catenovulum sp. 2E275 TaxID=2980497 RepID=UPI0021D366B3|nr:MFS transporter [Catenovulum sp. 2E275]MCU4674132.1 MFS transporter [Catenovulum sp. 2E275]
MTQAKHFSAHIKTTNQAIGLKQKYSLGLGFFAMFFANQGIGILAIPFYQMTLAIDPFLLSLAMTLPVLIASFIGPWVGHLSDNFQSRYGRRRPFIFIAAWLSAVSFGLIWMVPQGWSQTAQLSYFFVFSALFNIFSTFLIVPTTCLSYEITSNPKQRTQIMGLTTYFLRFASLIYHWIFPLSQLAIFSSIFVGIQFVGWGVGLFLIGLLGMLPALFINENIKEKIKESTAESSQQSFPLQQNKTSLTTSVKAALSYKPLLILFLICVMQVCGAAFAASFDYYLIVYYLYDGDLTQGSILKGGLSSAHALFGIVSAAVISYLAQKYGKKRVLNWVFMVTVLGGFAKWFIFNPNWPWLVLLDAVLCAPIWSAMTIIIPAMLADLTDIDHQKTGLKREGIFVALYNWVNNFSGAGALMLAGLSLNLIGFNAQFAEQQTEQSLLMMRLILVFGTVICALVCLILLRFLKIER